MTASCWKRLPTASVRTGVATASPPLSSVHVGRKPAAVARPNSRTRMCTRRSMTPHAQTRRLTNGRICLAKAACAASHASRWCTHIFASTGPRDRARLRREPARVRPVPQPTLTHRTADRSTAASRQDCRGRPSTADTLRPLGLRAGRACEAMSRLMLPMKTPCVQRLPEPSGWACRARPAGAAKRPCSLALQVHQLTQAPCASG